MGMSFSNFHVLSNGKVSVEKFATLLTKHFKTRGWIAATSDEFDLMISFAF